MNRRLFGALGVIAVLTWAGACKEDPLSDFDGNPAALVTDFTYLQLDAGTSIAVTASVLDGRGAPMPEPVTFAPCSNVVSVEIDTSYHPVPATSSRAIVEGVTTEATCVVVTGGGFIDTIQVAVLPPTFAGVLSSTTPLGGDTMTIARTTQFGFNPATATVTFGGDFEATILSATTDTLVLLVPFSDPDPLTISGITVSYAPGVEITRPTTATVTQTGTLWAGDSAFATAPIIPLPALGDTVLMVATFAGDNVAECGGAGPCVIYEFTVAATTTLTFITDWDSDADIDIYACDTPNPSGCFEEGGGGATGAHPQEFTFDFPAGTHYFIVENFDGVFTRNIKVTISQP
jgi:hypothetical protein